MQENKECSKFNNTYSFSKVIFCFSSLFIFRLGFQRFVCISYVCAWMCLFLCVVFVCVCVCICVCVCVCVCLCISVFTSRLLASTITHVRLIIQHTLSTSNISNTLISLVIYIFGTYKFYRLLYKSIFSNNTTTSIWCLFYQKIFSMHVCIYIYLTLLTLYLFAN